MSGPVWEDGSWIGLPTLDRDLVADVCVVGLGGSGLVAVQSLEARGAHVVGIDAGAVGGGAAGRNGGFVLAGLARSYDQAVSQLGRYQAAVLYRRTLEEMDRTIGFRRVGSVRIEDDAAGRASCSAQAAALRADGFAVEPYEGPEGRGLLFPSDGVIDPLARCRDLARPSGAALFEQTPALSVSGSSVVTPGGVISCGAVVVAVDGNLDLLLPEVPVRTVRLQMLATAPSSVEIPRPVYLRGGYEYWQQLPDGRVAVGGFRDVGGLAEETRSIETSSLVQERLESLLRRRIGVREPVTHRWAASVGYTDDGLPFVGEVRPGVWAAGGYCGTGNVIGALCGRQLAANALGEDASFWPLR